MGSEGFLPKDKTFSTRAITTRFDPFQWDSWCVVTPIVLSTTFKQAAPAQPKKHIYGRSGNPTREVLEEVLAAIEKAKHGLCFSTGLSAVNSVCHLLKAGDHLLAMGDVYGGVYRMFDQILPTHGLDVEFIDLSDPNILYNKVKNNTKMVWIETPTNPLIKYVDIEAVSQIAHKYDLLVVVDSTFLSPYFMKPLTLGADIVIHSLTKYINGHSDVIMGAALTDDDKLYERLKFLQNSNGVVPSPFDCYLVLRSIKSLKYRMEQHMKSSYSIAKFLESHPKVESVIHPGLQSHPERKLAQKQSSGWGGMLSFYLKGGLKESTAFISKLKIFTLAESLGGYESLIEIPSVMTHASVPAEEKKKLRLTDNLIRVSVGLEEEEDLIADLKQALS
ncbi:hypothetical protein V9T40_003444 [Parthenolecanium corni]|uniref:cystathionine gamma-lyase n=1 Tax=Parthenolecanium corni TaxID=536013 RepID=A0AAN9TVB8_9HEMI